MSSADPQSAPLKNIRVMDLSRVFAMPFAGANLADLGAEVIKIDTCQTQFMIQLGLSQDLSPIMKPVNSGGSKVVLFRT